MSNTDQAITEVYKYVLDKLSVSERLHLATLILKDLCEHNVAVVDNNDTWTEQDQLECTALSLQYANTLFTEDEELV